MDVGDLSNHVKYCVSVLSLQWAIIRTSPVGIPYNKTQFIVHTGLKANTNKTQTKHKQADLRCSSKTGYVHGGNRLYIIGGMIQTLNST